MALGKSLSEIREMPYDEFLSWQIFYMIEPWGWHDAEYRTAALLTMLANTHITKKSQAKKIEDYVRNIPRLIEQREAEMKRQEELKEHYKKATREERAKMIAASLGRATKDKR